MKRLIFPVLLFCLTAYGYASEAGDHADEWSPVSAGPITTWTAPLCGKNRLVVQPFLFYNKARGVFNSDSHSDKLPEGDKKLEYQYALFMQYGLIDRLEAAGQLMYQENYQRQAGASARDGGIADSYAFLRYCLIEEKGRLPHLTGVFQVKVPTGKYQKLDPDKLGTDNKAPDTGGGSYDLGGGINLTKKMRPFVLHADASYSFPLQTKVDGVRTRYAPYLNYDFGVEYFLPKGFNLMCEFNGLVQGDKKAGGGRVPASDVRALNIVAGAGWSCDKVQTIAAYQRTVAGTNVDANDSIIFSFVYTF